MLFTKLTLPFVIRRMPCRVRPLVAAACWLIAKRLADDTPPNVLPPVRIANTVLASFASAALEVSCLGMVGSAGMPGLAGWGFGTGAGLLENAVWPFLVTYGAGRLLRSATGYIYHLVALLLAAHFVVLPQRLTRSAGKHDGLDRERGDAEEGRSFLGRNQTGPRPASPQGPGGKARAVRGLIRSDMLPLFVASGALSLLQYGVARALDVSGFETFAHFHAAYCAALHLGTWLGRSSIRFVRVRNFRLPSVALSVWAAVALFNAVFLVSNHIAFFLALLVGVVGGSAYMNVLARTMEGSRSAADREFGLGLVTAGEAGGMAAGGVLGAVLETAMCGSLVSGRRWCRRSR